MSTNLSSKQVHLQLNFHCSLNPTKTSGCLSNYNHRILRENAMFWKGPSGWLLNMSWLMHWDPREHEQLSNIIQKYPSTFAKILPYFVRENGDNISIKMMQTRTALFSTRMLVIQLMCWLSSQFWSWFLREHKLLQPLSKHSWREIKLLHKIQVYPSSLLLSHSWKEHKLLQLLSEHLS